MGKQRLSLGLVLLTATSMSVAANCDNGDTVVSVNVSYDSTAMDVQSAVAKLHIIISPKSGGGSPVTADVQINRDSDGGITNAAYKRVTVNGLSGMADVEVDAQDTGGSTLLSDSETVSLAEHGAVAVFIKFARVVATPDASTDDAATGSGGTTGSGGETGSGGTIGSGGAVGTGGVITVGSGGAEAAGGAKGSGGSPGSAGITGDSAGGHASGGTSGGAQSSTGGNHGTGGA